MWKSNELLGATQKLLDILTTPEHVTTLTTAGLTVPPLITALTTPRDIYGDDEQAQEMFKTKLTSASAKERASGQTLYDKLSDLVDALSGMVGKKSALGKEIRAIRKQLNDAGNASGDEGSGSGSDSGSGSGSGSDSGSS